MANLDTLNARLREHFSKNAADLLCIQAAFVGPEVAQQLILECFRRRPRPSSGSKINERTVLKVLDEFTGL